MYDFLIIGGGPAGVSAAIYARRAGLSVALVCRDTGALGKTPLLENYYGFAEPITGEDLFARGKAQACRLGCQWITDEVVSLSYEESYVVTGTQGVYSAKAVLLATGANRATLPIPGIDTLEGAGVSYCAICDAFFYRGKEVAVLGAGEYALHEASVLLPVCSRVTLLTHGEPAPQNLPEGLVVDTRPLSSLMGTDCLKAVYFTQGQDLAVSGLFVALGVAGSDALARKIGAMTEQNHITVNAQMETTLPGLFAAGDCTGGLKQIAKAVHDGAVAGLSATRWVRSLG